VWLLRLFQKAQTTLKEPGKKSKHPTKVQRGDRSLHNYKDFKGCQISDEPHPRPLSAAASQLLQPIQP